MAVGPRGSVAAAGAPDRAGCGGAGMRAVAPGRAALARSPSGFVAPCDSARSVSALRPAGGVFAGLRRRRPPRAGAGPAVLARNPPRAASSGRSCGVPSATSAFRPMPAGMHAHGARHGAAAANGWIFRGLTYVDLVREAQPV